MYSLTEAKIKEKKKVIIRSASNLFVKYAQNESRYNIQQKRKKFVKIFKFKDSPVIHAPEFFAMLH